MSYPQVVGQTTAVSSFTIPPNPLDFRYDIFDCFEDPQTCILGTFCTPCLLGMTKEKLDGTNCVAVSLVQTCASYFGLCCILSMVYRKDSRLQFGIAPVDELNEVLVNVCCNPCATCQVAMEVDARIAEGSHIPGSGFSSGLLGSLDSRTLHQAPNNHTFAPPPPGQQQGGYPQQQVPPPQGYAAQPYSQPQQPQPYAQNYPQPQSYQNAPPVYQADPYAQPQQPQQGFSKAEQL
eukprot:TRINITY_DN797_c0_g1_i1.p1 TRINITY_DN797_c0_g1~~TRINITY_DN797_c0_g1_i1.p1  ORF type:complete len:235 (-),score=48.72 TRINITY_DN797_c0_g1_i1:60-764(-)